MEWPPKKTSEREQSLLHTKTDLTRSRSMSSLQNGPSSLQNRPGGIRALKDLFESKMDTQPRAGSWALPPRVKVANATPVVSGHAGKRERGPQKKTAATDATLAAADDDATVDAEAKGANANNNTKEQEVTGLFFFEKCKTNGIRCNQIHNIIIQSNIVLESNA